MTLVFAPLLVCIIGAILYALPTPVKVSEMGKIAFFCGLFWLVYLAKTLRF
jgi:hypothetical protein